MSVITTWVCIGVSMFAGFVLILLGVMPDDDD